MTNETERDPTDDAWSETDSPSVPRRQLIDAGLFVAALLLCVVLVAKGRNGSVWAAIVVGVYGVSLVLRQVKSGESLSPTVRDSPYFLGFLLTLFAIGKLFLDFSARGGATRDPAALGEAGWAVVLTGVGLVFRQLTNSLDRSEGSEHALLDKMNRSVQDHLQDFAQSQSLFNKLANDLSETVRKQSTAAVEFTLRASRAAKLLEQLEAEFPARYDTVVKAIDNAGAKLNEQVGSAARALLESQRSVTESITEGQTKLAEQLRQGRGPLTEASKEALEAAEKVATALNSAVGSLALNASAFAAEVAKYPEATKLLSDSLLSAREAVAAAKGGLQTLATQSADTGSKLLAAGTRVDDHALILERATRERAVALKKEMEQINELIDEVVKAVGGRLTKFDDGTHR